MSEEEEVAQKDTEVCQRCGEPLELPPDMDKDQLDYLKENGLLLCTKCQTEEDLEGKEAKAFKGELRFERRLWKPTLKYAKRLLEEVTFRVNENTVKLCEMDSNRVAMLKAVMHTADLGDYSGEEHPDKLLCVDLATFSNAVKQASFKKARCDGQSLYFPKKWGEYRMPLLMGSEEEIPIPQVEYTAQGNIDWTKLFGKLKWFKDKPEKVRLTAKDGKLRMRLGNGIGEHLEAELGDFEGEAEATYSLEYLKVIKSRGYSSKKWEVEFADGMPLHARKTKQIGERHSLQLDYWVAPRVD